MTTDILINQPDVKLRKKPDSDKNRYLKHFLYSFREKPLFAVLFISLDVG